MTRADQDKMEGVTVGLTKALARSGMPRLPFYIRVVGAPAVFVAACTLAAGAGPLADFAVLRVVGIIACLAILVWLNMPLREPGSS